MIKGNLNNLKKSNIGYSPYSLNYMYLEIEEDFVFLQKKLDYPIHY